MFKARVFSLVFMKFTKSTCWSFTVVNHYVQNSIHKYLFYRHGKRPGGGGKSGLFHQNRGNDSFHQDRGYEKQMTYMREMYTRVVGSLGSGHLR